MADGLSVAISHQADAMRQAPLAMDKLEYPLPASGDAEYIISSNIIDMADRVRVADKVVPGSQATWAFEMDGTTYRVIVQVDHG